MLQRLFVSTNSKKCTSPILEQHDDKGMHFDPSLTPSPPSQLQLQVANEAKKGVITQQCVQIGCIVQGRAQKSPLFWRFSEGFDFLRSALLSRNSSAGPFKLNKITDFLQIRPVNPLVLRMPLVSTLLSNIMSGKPFRAANYAINRFQGVTPNYLC